MICQDGFITSHAVENIELLEDDKVKAFVGEYNPEQYLLNPKMPMAVGPYATSPFYMESKMNQNEAMKNAKQVILDVANDFAKISGRQYGFFEEYKLEDADYAIVMIGSAAGTTKEAIDALRAQGKKVGLLKLRVFRPFPGEEIAKALAHTKAVAILDRSEGFRAGGGPLSAEIKEHLYDIGASTKAVSYIYGLGGRDYTTVEATDVFNQLEEMIEQGKTIPQYQYIGLRK
jgi:pyruvate ferredoxin oxidoreductase alpha subunit